MADETTTTAPRPMKVQVTFKSGVQVEFHADVFTKTTHRIDGHITGYSWSSGDPMVPHLFHINVAEVAAIVTTRETSDVVEPEPEKAEVSL